MKFIRSQIPEVVIIQPEIHEDKRGFFFESYQEKLFEEHGIPTHFVQDNHSSSMKGVLRGLHFQAHPKAQAKLVRVIRGAVFDVAVDVRRESKTFGRFVATHLSAENKEMIYIPVGFAHGFCVLEDGTEFLYKASDFYSPKHERGIIWDDPAISIPWPKLDVPFILSEKDKCFPRLSDSKDLF